MIQLDRISKSFGARQLFDELSWQLSPGRRIGLIGPNGAGKTTLFRILSGEMEPDSGRVVVPRSATIGLLPQEVGDIDDLLPLDFVLAGRADLVEAEARIDALTRMIEKGGPEHELARHVEELGGLQEHFRAEGGYRMRAVASEILDGMGFREDLLVTRARQLSGGWKVRLVLSRLLFVRPSVLLMDEPTNHLDVPAVEWLEGFLQNYEGTVVLISHDRYFLDRLVNETAAIEPDGFYQSPGGYSTWERLRAERLEQLEKQREGQERKIRETEQFIDRFRSKASKAKQVQSRVKALEKIERVDRPTERKAMTVFRFAESPPSGKTVVEGLRLAKSYDENVVYRDVTFRVERGERVALVGPNGAGKSTLLRMVSGREAPDAGEVQFGHQVVCGYFGQHQVDELDPAHTVLESMERAATPETHPMCRSILGVFLFQGDDVFKRVSVLSGGERNRLALARMLLKPSNLLLLDEPTNHLDIQSRDVLRDALRRYAGSIVFVSHDRHFINGVATRVVHVEARTLRDYPGDYEYYRYKRSEEREKGTLPSADTSTRQATDEGAAKENRKDRRRREAEFRKAFQERCGPLRKKLETCEKRIATLEAEKQRTSDALANPDLYDGTQAARVTSLQKDEARLAAELAQEYDRWAELSERMEEAESELRTEWGLDDVELA